MILLAFIAGLGIGALVGAWVVTLLVASAREHRRGGDIFDHRRPW